MNTKLKRAAYSIVPFVLLVLWKMLLAPEIGITEYVVLLVLFGAHGMAQFADGFERGLKCHTQ